jgi:hypothetical protein
MFEWEEDSAEVEYRMLVIEHHNRQKKTAVYESLLS